MWLLVNILVPFLIWPSLISFEQTCHERFPAIFIVFSTYLDEEILASQTTTSQIYYQNTRIYGIAGYFRYGLQVSLFKVATKDLKLLS